jgi:predicted component of type VI protein secretion system
MPRYIEFEHHSRALGPGVLTIGSGAEAAFRIRDHGLEPLHALVTLERDGRALLERATPDALVAINGTTLRESRAVLEVGDAIRLGRAEITFTDSPSQRTTSDEGYLHDLRRARLYTLGEGVVIGRDRASTIVLHEPSVAPKHAEVRPLNGGGGYVLAPLGNVVLVNGTRVAEPVRLQEGDEVEVGRTTLRFSTVVPSNSMIEDSKRAQQGTRAATRARASRAGIATERRARRWRSAKKNVGRAAAAAIAAALIAAAVLTFYEGKLATTAEGAKVTAPAAGDVVTPAQATTP